MKKFELCALGAIGAAVVGLVTAAVELPLDGKTVAPRATFAPASTEVAHRPVSVGPIVRVAVRRPMTGPSHSVKSLADHFASLGYDLEAVAAGERHVPRVTLASIPDDIKDIREVKERKELFFQAILPLVLQVNEEISADRDRLWRIRVDKALGRSLKAVDRLWLAVMSERYRVNRGDLDALLRRVDIIPTSLALAQAAEESGWGTSRFAREGNAIYGQWTFNPSNGLKPRDIENGKNHRVRAFDDLIGSVRAYARNLNTHRAYRRFRDLRSEMRRKGEPPNGRALVETLDSYSERGEDYVRSIQRIMKANELQKLDEARLQVQGGSGLQMAGEPASPLGRPSEDPAIPDGESAI